MPLLVGLGTIAGGGTLASLALFFLKTGAIVFGSGLAIVPFMRAGVVDQHHWLSNSQFLDSVAIGLITPGPVVISAGFIGYLVAGLPGAIVSSLAIFTPIYLGVVVPGRWFLRHRGNAQVRAFVAGATAAAGGALGGAVVVLTREAVTDWITAIIALATRGWGDSARTIPATHSAPQSPCVTSYLDGGDPSDEKPAVLSWIISIIHDGETC
jgi:chromate transporter